MCDGHCISGLCCQTAVKTDVKLWNPKTINPIKSRLPRILFLNSFHSRENSSVDFNFVELACNYVEYREVPSPPASQFRSILRQKAVSVCRTDRSTCRTQYFQVLHCSAM